MKSIVSSCHPSAVGTPVVVVFLLFFFTVHDFQMYAFSGSKFSGASHTLFHSEPHVHKCHVMLGYVAPYTEIYSCSALLVITTDQRDSGPHG